MTGGSVHVDGLSMSKKVKKNRERLDGGEKRVQTAVSASKERFWLSLGGACQAEVEVGARGRRADQPDFTDFKISQTEPQLQPEPRSKSHSWQGVSENEADSEEPPQRWTSEGWSVHMLNTAVRTLRFVFAYWLERTCHDHVSALCPLCCICMIQSVSQL